MITMRDFGNPEKGGRLGNSLFQLCSIIGISERLNHPYILPNWNYSDYFNLKINTGDFSLPAIGIREPNFHYFEEFYKLILPGRNYNLNGYFQSEKYFGSQKLRFKNQMYYDSQKEIVGIHVRRGDYVNNPYYYQLPRAYYFNALTRHIPDINNKLVFVFSDDINYCKQIFPDNFQFIEGNTDIEDLRMLAACDYHVLSNSTFSWWGAYLSNSKKVIRPVHYFAGNGLKNNTKDFWPKEWIAM